MQNMNGNYILVKSQDSYNGADDEFVELLRDQYGIIEDSPPTFYLLFIKQKTRLLSDIFATWDLYQQNLAGKDVVLVMFHKKAPHVTPPMSTQYILEPKMKKNFSLIVDVIYWEGQLDGDSSELAAYAIREMFGSAPRSLPPSVSTYVKKHDSTTNQISKDKKGNYNLLKSQDSCNGADDEFIKLLRDRCGIIEDSPPTFFLLFIRKKKKYPIERYISDIWGPYQVDVAGKDVVLVVIHKKEPHKSTQDLLYPEDKKNFSLIVDVIYWHGRLDGDSSEMAADAIREMFGSAPRSLPPSVSSDATKHDRSTTNHISKDKNEMFGSAPRSLPHSTSTYVMKHDSTTKHGKNEMFGSAPRSLPHSTSTYVAKEDRNTAIQISKDQNGCYILLKSQDNYNGADDKFIKILRDRYCIIEDSPRFILLFILKKTRLPSDISATWDLYQEELGDKDVVLVVFHHLAPHVPPPVRSQDYLRSAVKNNFSLIVDVIYWQGQLDGDSSALAADAIREMLGSAPRSVQHSSSAYAKQKSSSAIKKSKNGEEQQ